MEKSGEALFEKILSVKKKARLSPRALAEVKEGHLTRGEEDIRCSVYSLPETSGLLEDEETKLA